jgi:transcriptional regulator with XRE-family HTH domain
VNAEVAVLVHGAARPSSVGRLLHRIRLAAGLSQADAAVAIEVPIQLIKELEAGRATLGYLEGLRLAKAYQLCPLCFRRAFEAGWRGRASRLRSTSTRSGRAARGVRLQRSPRRARRRQLTHAGDAAAR